jgi:hypothetical protein
MSGDLLRILELPEVFEALVTKVARIECAA